MTMTDITQCHKVLVIVIPRDMLSSLFVNMILLMVHGQVLRRTTDHTLISISVKDSCTFPFPTNIKKQILVGAMNQISRLLFCFV